MKSKSILYRALGLLLLLAVVLAGCHAKDEPVSVERPSASAGAASPSDVSSDASALEAMQIIEEQVSKLRGLETLRPVTKAFLTTDELRTRVEEDFFEDVTVEEVHDELLLYVSLELAEPGLDLYNLYLDLLAEQVLGFYDPETEELYVVKSTDEPGAMVRSTFAHEYTHALQDQHFDLEALGFTNDDQGDEEDSERSFAIRSLVEGDATLLSQQYMINYFDRDDLQEILSESEAVDTSVLDSAPAVLRESLLFPYEAGWSFVTALFADGGWSAVDAAYANPPVSTEQILHPDRYPDDVPQVIALPPLTDTLGSGWRLVDEDVLGEFGLQLYLKVHSDLSAAEVAAEGWGGDRYAVYWRDDETGFVLVTRLGWDTPADMDEFFDTYIQFAEARYGSGSARREGDTRLWWLGDDTMLLARNDEGEILILIAPDEATLDAVHTLFPDF